MGKQDENRIIASGLSYAYPEAQVNAVDNVSMRVKKGEFLAILGHNGSGKIGRASCRERVLFLV